MEIDRIIHRVSTITILELEIHELNFSYCSEEEYFEVLEMQKKIMKEAFPKKTYFLLNVKNGPTSSRVIEYAKKFVLENQHYQATTAIYNMNSLAKLILRMVNLISTDKTNVFDSREKAIDFLQSVYEESSQLSTYR